MKLNIFWILLLILPHICLGTLSKSDRKSTKKEKPAKKSQEKKEEFVKLDSSEKKRMLQQEETISYEKKNFPNPTLAYVTPWNGKGYDIAKFAAKKFSHISPTWFQVLPSVSEKQKSCIIEGTHDIDHGWIADVRSNNSEVFIVPRFIFEKWTSKDYLDLLHNEMWQSKCVERVVNLILRNEMQGAVIEVWGQIIGVAASTYREEVLEFVAAVGKSFHAHNLQLIITIPAELDSFSKPIGMTLPEEMAKLIENVDFVHVMTYDFKAERLRGVAPLFWIRDNIEYLLQHLSTGASRILLGINFYGYRVKENEFSALTAPTFKALLIEDDTEVYWDLYADEHFAYSKKRKEMAYYPTMESLSKRYDLARSLGVGIGIWEIGQGFDYFTQLL